MPWMALAFLAGIAFVETRADLDGLARCAPLIALAACLILVPRARLVAVVALGVLWAWWRAELRLEERLPAELEGRDLTVSGEVVSLPETSPGRVQFDFRVAAASVNVPDALIRLSWYDAARLPRAGERWHLLVRLRQPRGFANAGGFDYEAQLFRESIGATGYVRASPGNRLLRPAGWRRPVLQLRSAIAARMRAVLGESPAAGVLVGLAVGATPGITPEQWRVFSVTGTTHLIAISGLHVTMIAAFAMLLASAGWRLLPRPPRTTRLDCAAFSGALAATAYALLAGFSVPTQRTLAMLIVALAAVRLRRAQPGSHALALALVVVLLIDPHAALTAGFWLSFAAVAAILLALSDGRAARSRLREFFGTQWAVTLALAPATLVLFGSVSLIAPLANLIAIPLFSALLVPMTLIGVALLALIPPAGELVLLLAACIFESAWPLLEFAAAWPGALIHLPAPPFWLLPALALAAIVAILPFPARIRVIGFAFALPVVWPPLEATKEQELDVDVLDVGQGLAVVLRTARHVLVYDTGPAFRSGRSAGDLAVLPFLHQVGVRRIDLLVLSHSDNDHTGGAMAIAGALPIGRVRYGGAASALGIPDAPCRRGETWSWDGVSFAFLHPRAGESWNDNDGSCILRVETAHHALLLMGDAERMAEGHLLAHATPGRADVVVVPHHGSRSSSSDALVRSVRARYAVVSAGHGNRWQFPHADVVQRWCASGAAVIETAQWGGVNIRFSSSDAELRPQGYRQTHRRYWQASVPRAGLSLCATDNALVSSRAV